MSNRNHSLFKIVIIAGIFGIVAIFITSVLLNALSFTGGVEAIGSTTLNNEGLTIIWDFSANFVANISIGFVVAVLVGIMLHIRKKSNIVDTPDSSNNNTQQNRHN